MVPACLKFLNTAKGLLAIPGAISRLVSISEPTAQHVTLIFSCACKYSLRVRPLSIRRRATLRRLDLALQTQARGVHEQNGHASNAYGPTLEPHFRETMEARKPYFRTRKCDVEGQLKNHWFQGSCQWIWVFQLAQNALRTLLKMISGSQESGPLPESKSDKTLWVLELLKLMADIFQGKYLIIVDSTGLLLLPDHSNKFLDRTSS